MDSAAFESTVQRMVANLPAGGGGVSTNILDSFIDILGQLLRALNHVFPECKDTEASMLQFEALVKPNVQVQKTFMTMWKETMQTHKAAVANRDIEPISAIAFPIIAKLHLRQKWMDPGFTDEDKQSFWDFLDQLNACADVYDQVPSQLMNQMESVIGRISSKLQGGTLDANDMSIESITQAVMQGVSQEDLATFTRNIPQLAQTITSLGPMKQFAPLLQQMGLRTG